MWIFSFQIVGGLLVLGLGGEFLVRGAARLARSLGVSALVIGLTIVAFGTSAPEIAVSISAGVQGHDDLAVANVVGSCLLNTLLVLGLAALTRPLKVSRGITTTDYPVMVLVLAAFTFFAAVHVHLYTDDPGRIDRWHGLLFVAALAGYVLLTYFLARRQPQVVEAEYQASIGPARSPLLNSLLVILGLVGLVFGADQIVEGGVGVARAVGISERVIGLTLVAIGTSLPEIATCVVAARRNQPDIAIGNVVGSNIFNILAVIGIASVASPSGGLEVNRQILFQDVPAMLAAAILIFPILRTGRSVKQREGAVLILLYLAYFSWTLWSR